MLFFSNALYANVKHHIVYTVHKRILTEDTHGSWVVYVNNLLVLITGNAWL